MEACSDWEFPIFLTLMLTGLRPGELCHLLLEDLDLKANLLHVRNNHRSVGRSRRVPSGRFQSSTCWRKCSGGR